jgi:Holliday junction resolvase RusA-like endonuclease
VTLSFQVYGVPQPKGSKTLNRTRTGQVIGMRESNDKVLAPWSDTVARSTRIAMRSAGMAGPLDGPLALTVTFRHPRPKTLRKSAVYCAVKPDGDKLLRAVADAMASAGAMVNDSRIAIWHAEQIYAPLDDPWTGAHILLRPISELRPHEDLHVGNGEQGAFL